MFTRQKNGIEYFAYESAYLNIKILNNSQKNNEHIRQKFS